MIIYYHSTNKNAIIITNRHFVARYVLLLPCISIKIFMSSSANHEKIAQIFQDKRR